MESVLHCIGLLTMATLCCAGGGPCEFYLVTGAYGVSDGAITASSTHATCPIVTARFNSNKGWCPAHTGDGHYLQVEFQSVSVLKAVLTLGRHDYSQWVSSYNVNISMDGLTWSSILNATGDVKLFPGNNDRDTVVTNKLEGAVVAKYIRVISVSGNSYRSMRLEVQGYPVSNVSCTCNKWKAKLGSAGDVLPVLMDIDVPNQGLCGVKCYRQPECHSFLFDVTSAWCRLLKEALDGSPMTVNLDGVWYFMKTCLLPLPI